MQKRSAPLAHVFMLVRLSNIVILTLSIRFFALLALVLVPGSVIRCFRSKGGDRVKKVLFTATLLLLCSILCVGVCAEGIGYTDSHSGMHFTLPEGWRETKVEDAVVYFTATEMMPTIAFAAVDYYEASKETASWKQMLDRVPGSRIDYNNSLLTEKIIVDELGCSEEEISRIFLSGREYFSVQTKRYDGQNVHLLLRVENGFSYMFAFGDTVTHPQHDAFLDMVANAEYPIYSMDEKTSIVWELVIVLVSFVLHCIPIAVFRYGIKKEPVENAKEISIVYGIGAVFVGWSIGRLLDVTGIGVCAVGIVAGAVVNYRMLLK